MADIGHEDTDKIIKQMEKRINKVYRQASKEIADKCDDYFRRFSVKDKLKRDELKAGLITPKEYQEWRKGQLIVGERWIKLRNQLARDMHNTNLIARSIVDGYMPEVYAINHDYATYLCEVGSGINTSYTLYSREAVENIMRENPRLLPMPGKALSERIAAGKDILWNNQQIQSVMLQGILQGESIPKLAKRLRTEVADRNRKASIRNARTMATTAQNAGRMDAFNRAESKGIKMQKTWVATLDSRTRHAHRLLDGVTIPNDDVFVTEYGELKYPGDPAGDPADIYNCFVGNTKIASDSEIVRSYKHEYKGELITIKTACDVQFTCTPNHPILTTRGWVAAKLLNDRDNLIIASISNNVTSRGYPDINHRFSSIKAIHEFFDVSGIKRTACGMVNFHGDIPTSNVEIITKKRFLWGDIYARFRERINKILLKCSNKTLVRKSTFMKHFLRVFASTFSNISCKSKCLTFFKRCVRHSNIHRFRTIPDRNIVLTEDTINDLTTKTKISRKLFNGRSCKVFGDKIISINVSSSHCYVYNLQTKNNYYFVNSIIPQNGGKSNGKFAIAHNCRCTMIAQIQGFERDINANRVMGAYNDDGTQMTYAEWKKGKEEPRDILHQEKVGNAIRGAHIQKYRRNAKEAQRRLVK